MKRENEMPFGASVLYVCFCLWTTAARIVELCLENLGMLYVGGKAYYA